MKDPFSEKSNSTECKNTETEAATGRGRDRVDLFGTMAPGELEKIIFTNRKFFRISAELSINSN